MGDRVLKHLHSYLRGKWTPGTGDDIELKNPTNGDTVALCQRATGLGEAMAWAREVGGPAMRALSLGERAAKLRETSKAIQAHRDELLDLAAANGGNTRGDGKFDVDGATAVLTAYGYLGKQLADGGTEQTPWLLDDEAAELFKGSKLRARHIWLPRRGVAVHINAFNFPAWGTAEKAATAWLAGMPILTKPATSTSVVAHRMVEIIAEAGIWPEGALQLLMGPAGDLLDHVGSQDVVAFTGSADTGMKIRGHAQVMRKGTRVNVEADSLNAVVVGPDVERGTELFDLVIRDVVTEMTQKAGQKCTATRRILVPTQRLAEIREVLVERLDEIAQRVGEPTDKANRMGPLATASQLRDGRAGVAALAERAKIVRGDPQRTKFNGVEDGQGYFLEPILLEASAADALDANAPFHATEVFGPVATLVPYDGSVEQAATIVGLGEGSLVSTVYTDDRDFLRAATTELGAYLGRLVVADEKVAGASMSPGCVFPSANHGGPGRAGAGGELGGLAGVHLYMQRVAVQGGASQLARLLGKS